MKAVPSSHSEIRKLLDTSAVRVRWCDIWERGDFVTTTRLLSHNSYKSSSSTRVRRVIGDGEWSETRRTLMSLGCRHGRDYWHTGRPRHSTIHNNSMPYKLCLVAHIGYRHHHHCQVVKYHTAAERGFFQKSVPAPIKV